MQITTGYTENGLPFGCVKGGARHLVILAGGPDFQHAPLKKTLLKMALGKFLPLTDSHTIWYVSRRKGLKRGMSCAEIAEDYAVWMRQAGMGKVDLVGVSSGGSYGLPLSADHPDLVEKLVLVESAARVGEGGKRLTREMAEAIQAGSTRRAVKKVMGAIHHGGFKGTLMGWMGWLMAPMVMGKAGEADLEGGWAEVEAEERLDFRDRLAEVKCPVLVIGADGDVFYPLSHFEETAAGLPNGRFEYFGNIGHTVTETPRLTRALREFLSSPG
jgi:pimeloyl-ACP methyl ester carboxylesterase